MKIDKAAEDRVMSMLKEGKPDFALTNKIAHEWGYYMHVDEFVAAYQKGGPQTLRRLIARLLT